ncbi:hypothetical protein LFZ75_004622 [Salmonella enterica]|nr:hypothetical protein [Salmonella enterica]
MASMDYLPVSFLSMKLSMPALFWHLSWPAKTKIMGRTINPQHKKALHSAQLCPQHNAAAGCLFNASRLIPARSYIMFFSFTHRIVHRFCG